MTLRNIVDAGIGIEWSYQIVGWNNIKNTHEVLVESKMFGNEIVGTVCALMDYMEITHIYTKNDILVIEVRIED